VLHQKLNREIDHTSYIQLHKTEMGTIRKRFDIQIAQEAANIPAKFELDKTVKSITGIVVTSDREDLMFYRGTQKIEINGLEHFPDGYETKLLMMSLNIPQDYRYYNMKNALPGNGIINFSYTDNKHPLPQFAFTPYRVSLYLECEV
jgi:hypothetical protein